MSDKSIVGSSNEYLPCPFCGDRDIRFIESQREHPNDRGNGWRVECGSCPCELRWFTDRAEALEYWNKRAANAHETSAGPLWDRLMADINSEPCRWPGLRNEMRDWLIARPAQKADEQQGESREEFERDRGFVKR